MTSDTNQRFRKLREELNKTQTEWASIMGISRSGVTAIESGQRNVTDKHMKLLCVEPIDGKYINEEWLRTGEGEMFVEIDKDLALMDWAGSVLGSSDGSFKKRFVRMLSELDEQDWETLEKMALKLHSKKD